jgi:glutamyl-tRNA(Gln) amidotransferase subunit E
MPEGNLSPEEWQSVRHAAGGLQGDAVLVVWGPEEDVRTACDEIVIRAREACAGVPQETRQAMPDGTTGFERILPGPNRMYPDTDLPPISLDDRRIDGIRACLPATPWSREEAYRAAGVPEQLARRLSISPHARLFDDLGDAVKADPVLAASLVTDHLRHLQRKGADVTRLDAPFFVRLFQLLAKECIVPDGVVRIFDYQLCKGRCLVDEIIDRLGLTPATSEEIASTINGVLEHLDARQFQSPGAARRYTMGRIMRNLRGRVRGAEVSRLLDQGLGPGEAT